MHALRTRAANGIRRRLLRLWTSRGGGFYGFVAMVSFVYLEAVEIVGDLRGIRGLHLDLGSVISLIVNHFVEALVNGLMAALWPVFWLRSFGVSVLSAALLAGCYLAYRLVRPSVIRLLTPPGETALVGDPAGFTRALPVSRKN